MTTIWRKHETDSTWHVGRDDGGSFITLCNGGWSLLDEVDNLVKYDANPPHADRCEACQRVRIDQRRVERGLAELGEASTQEWPGVHELFDIGGDN